MFRQPAIVAAGVFPQTKVPGRMRTRVRGGGSVFIPFFISGLPLPRVISCLTINISTLVGRKESACCAKNNSSVT